MINKTEAAWDSTLHDDPRPSELRNKSKGGAKKNASKTKWQQGDHFMAHLACDLSPIAQSIWFMLWLKSDKWTGKAKVTNGLLVKFTGTSKSTVSRALKELREGGIIELVTQGASVNGHSYPSVYKVVTSPEMSLQQQSEEIDDSDLDADIPF